MVRFLVLSVFDLLQRFRIARYARRVIRPVFPFKTALPLEAGKRADGILRYRREQSAAVLGGNVLAIGMHVVQRPVLEVHHRAVAAQNEVIGDGQQSAVVVRKAGPQVADYAQLLTNLVQKPCRAVE